MDRAPSLTWAVAFNRIGFNCEAGLEIPCSELNNGGDNEELEHRWDASKERLADILRLDFGRICLLLFLSPWKREGV